MYRRFGEETLRTGEVMEVGCVQPPDAEWGERVEESLSHKPPIWLDHIRKAIRGETDDLESYFYIGHLRGEIVTGVMTVEHGRPSTGSGRPEVLEGRVGILGHVYTQPTHRRKGAYSRLMKYQMEDFRRRGGGVLLLGTVYETPPYRIYESFGFRGFAGRSGYMRYATEGDFEQNYYAPASASLRPVRWEDWAAANLLTSQPGDDVLRSASFKVVGIASFEEGFLHLKKGLEEDARRRAWVAESASGALAGLVMLTPDERFRGGAYLLDLIVHANFWDQAGGMLSAVEWPEAKVQCYTDVGCEGKVSALKAAGFTQEALLKKQLPRASGQALDVAIFTKDLR